MLIFQTAEAQTAMTDLLFAQAEVNSATDYAAVLLALYHIKRARESLKGLAIKLRPAKEAPAAADSGLFLTG